MQSKLNHSVTAQNVLKKFVRDKNIMVAFVSEPHVVRFNGWQYDSTSGAAIAIYHPGLWLSNTEVSDGFVAAIVGGGGFFAFTADTRDLPWVSPTSRGFSTLSN